MLLCKNLFHKLPDLLKKIEVMMENNNKNHKSSRYTCPQMYPEGNMIQRQQKIRQKFKPNFRVIPTQSKKQNNSGTEK